MKLDCRSRLKRMSQQLGLVFCLSLPLAANATQTGSVNPAAVNPANILNTLNQTLPGTQVPAAGGLGVESSHEDMKNVDAVTTKIQLHQVVMKGALHPVPANVTAIYQAEIGKRLSIRQIQAMADKMEATFRDDGYILVQVILPPQEIDPATGVVNIQIVEGQIERVIFTGDNPKGARTQLQRYAAQIEAEDPITYKTLDRFLNLANQIPGIDVSAQIVPDKLVVGAANLLIHVSRTPYTTFMNMNNRGTDYIGPFQASLGGAVYDILGADALALTYATTPDYFKEMQYGSVSYDLVLGYYATEINPSISFTETQPGSTLSAFEMKGQSSQYALNVNQPLLVSTAQNLTLQSGVSHTNSSNDVFGNETLYEDHITAVDLGLNYQGMFLNGFNNITLSSTTGLPILDAPSSESNPSIMGGQTQFIKVNLTGSRIQYLTQRFSYALGAQMQRTSDTLLSSEQIGYGGQTFGQGFSPYVISGDNGYMGSMALRYDLPTFTGVSLLQPQIFYDAGAVNLNAPPAGYASSAQAESAGVGLLLGTLHNWQMGLILAKPLSIRGASGVSMGWQGFFNITGLF